MSKRTIYIALFTVLGIMVSFLIHAGIEIPVIFLLVKDFDRYGLGLTWDQWYMIHHIGAILLFILGVVGGFFQGKYWWEVIYVQKKYTHGR